jgi:O-antigen ligase
MFSIRGMFFIVVFAYCAVKSIREPKYGYFLMLVLLVAKPLLFDIAPEVFTDFHAPLVLGVVLIFCCFLSGALTTLNRRALMSFGYLTLFTMACWLSRIDDPAGITAHKYVGEITNMWLLFLVGIAAVRTSRDLRELHLVLLVTATVLAAVSYWHYRLQGWAMPLPSRYNLDRNEFALTLAAFVPLFLLAVVRAQRTALKYLAAIPIVLIILCVIPSYSRGAFLALMFAFLLSVKLMPNRKLYCFIMILALCAGALRVSDSYWARISSSTDYEEEASAAGRIATYKAALTMFQSAPVVGIGVGNFNENFWDHCPEEYRIFCAPNKSVHNIYLQVLSETGLVGITALLLFLLSVLKPFLRMILPGNGPQSPHDKLCYAFGSTCLVLLLGYLLLPGAYGSLIYPFCASFVSAQLAKPDEEDPHADGPASA